jgi:hypothetical protein
LELESECVGPGIDDSDEDGDADGDDDDDGNRGDDAGGPEASEEIKVKPPSVSLSPLFNLATRHTSHVTRHTPRATCHAPSHIIPRLHAPSHHHSTLQQHISGVFVKI